MVRIVHQIAVAAFVAFAWNNLASAGEIQDAAQVGDLTKVRLLLSRNPGLVSNRDDAAAETPLHLAAEYGHKDVVEVLLSDKAPIDATDNQGDTPLHDAANNGQEDIVKLLLSRGANVNIKNTSYGETALHGAARDGSIAVVKMLLAKGADANAKDQFGGTPLHAAAMAGQGSTVEVDPAGNMKNVSGQFDGYMTVIQMLLNNGGDVNARTVSGLTPLHIASANDRKLIVELLIERGANVHAKSNSGKTPLQLAQDAGFQDVVQLLRHPILFSIFHLLKSILTIVVALAAAAGVLYFVRIVRVQKSLP